LKLLVSFLIFLSSLFCFIGLGNNSRGLIPSPKKETCFEKAGIQLFSTPTPLPPAAAQTQADSKRRETFSGKVSGVLSGHLLIVQEGEKTHRVNLYGVLSPSKGAPQGEKARGLLEQIAFGRVVKVEPIEPFDPKRIYALVHLEGRTLNEEMLRQGLAWVNENACILDVCKNWKSLQQEAKDSTKGIWSDPRGTPPWEKGEGKRRKKMR